MNGRIFDIQRFSVHDGPGIRTTVFMKGCPLSCAWCHNPEGLTDQIQLKYTANDCIDCGRCGTKTLENVEKCPTGALAICGRDICSAELIDELLKDKVFYGSDGGVTFSGGECLLQADFVAEMLKACKSNGINTAIDTSGYVDFTEIERTLEHCDLYLYDVKMMDTELHRQYTGVDNELILENLYRLSALAKDIWVRVVLIPNISDTDENIYRLAEFLSSLPRRHTVTLIPYHPLGISKYQTLGLSCEYNTDEKISADRISEIRAIFASYSIQTN